jgi:hypothetical protein
VELYDLKSDPFEKNDLSGSQPDVVKELLRKVEEWQATLPAQPSGAVFSKERTNQRFFVP